jgi:hypothetical protein
LAQAGVSAVVELGAGFVDATVDLDHQPYGGGEEVDDVAVNDHLTAKGHAQPTAGQRAPQAGF